MAREPENPQWHKLHNDLMYRLGSPDYLKSFEHAPKSVELLLSKAYFLAHDIDSVSIDRGPGTASQIGDDSDRHERGSAIADHPLASPDYPF